MTGIHGANAVSGVTIGRPANDDGSQCLALLANELSRLNAATLIDRDQSDMDAIVHRIDWVEQAIISAPCATHADLSVKVAVLASMLADPGGISCNMEHLIDRLQIDLANVELEEWRAIGCA